MSYGDMGMNDHHSQTLAAIARIKDACAAIDPATKGETDLITLYVRYGRDLSASLSQLVAAVRQQEHIDMLTRLRLDEAVALLDQIDTFRKFHHITER